ncbi:hypothetical protein VDGE_30607 [Verticillium dahliae]|uniref:HTH psq-type domain-containing protein n=1 Tax=Verticillium dahliae TaxID=27337 RepID=A0A444SAJ9_VERDA|nr:hypothetical protein VDGE_30607 [Verticillium dahliae]
MKRYTEEDVSNALQAIIDGCSTRKASRDWNIPATTLRGRLKGATTIREAKAPYQRLSQAQEQHLARWIIEQGALGWIRVVVTGLSGPFLHPPTNVVKTDNSSDTNVGKGHTWIVAF